MKKFISLLFVLAVATAYGQDADSYIALLRSDLKTDRKAMITKAMQFTNEEAAAFWPVYRDYEFELDKQGDARVASLKEYAEHLDKMTDQKAKELIENALSQQEERTKLRRKYFEKFSKVLPATKAARFMQVDNRMQLLLDVEIASQLPLMEKPGSAVK